MAAQRNQKYSVTAFNAESVVSRQFENFIRAEEAAAWLNIPLRSFNYYVAKGLIPSRKLGRHRLFLKSEIMEALRITTKATRSTILR